MLLLIDAGNSRVKWALASPASLPTAEQSGTSWMASGAVGYDALPSLAAHWKDARVTRVMLSNVAGDPVGNELAALFRTCFGKRAQVEVFKSSAERAGLRNAYRNPLQLGSDRFASSIAARALYPGQPLIVATCGTATTIDAISADGVFIGGMILPGLRLMASALANHTAQLPAVAERMGPDHPFADNTEEAIVLGCLSAQAGAIERSLARHPGARCILSGGAGKMVAPFLAVESEFVDNLVLIGLHVAAKEEQG